MSQSKVAIIASALSALVGTGYYLNNRVDVDSVAMRIKFEDFKQKHEKVYGDLAEEEKRFAIYSDNLYYIDQ